MVCGRSSCRRFLALGVGIPRVITMARDIWTDLYGEVETHRIQPYQALKTYICPGCTQEIPAGMGHTVAVPRDAPDLRRHWHHVCWQRRITGASR